jgi:hypothetical protein
MLLSSAATGVVQVVVATPASATPSAVQLLGEGVDSCVAPTAAQMANFWNGSPYYYWGIYIGGDERSCAQPNLTTSWIATVTNGTANGISMAWKLMPLWVGPQDPCESGFGNTISTNTTTAFSQGQTQAGDAYDEWVNTLHQSASTPMVYDMEVSTGTITSTCLAAMKSFISGWVSDLHYPPASKAGLYTSTCGGDLNDFASIANPPDFIDGADYGTSKSTSSLDCITSSNWSHQQRHKQYASPHKVTYNGTTIQVDSRCANSWVYGTYGVQNTAQGCS